MQCGLSPQFWQTMRKVWEHSRGADFRPLRSHERQTWCVLRTLALRWQCSAMDLRASTCSKKKVFRPHGRQAKYRKTKMGQAWSDLNADDACVARATDALDELVWDSSVVVNQDGVQKILDECGVYKQSELALLSANMRNGQAEQTKKYNFYRDKINPCDDGSYAGSKFMLLHSSNALRYGLAASYLTSLENFGRV